MFPLLKRPHRASHAHGSGRPALAVLLRLAALVVLSLFAGYRLGRSRPAAAQGSEHLAAGNRRQRSCALDAARSPWVQHCQRLQDVCVDQGQLILYGNQYQQRGDRPAAPLPELLVSQNKVFVWPWRDVAGEGVGGDGEEGDEPVEGTSVAHGSVRRLAFTQQTDYRRHLAPPPLRPASAQEGAPYLQQPRFSTCTIPVLLAVTWRNNLFHVLDNAAVWHAMARRTPWQQHLKPVMLTPDGIALTSIEAGVLPALGPLSLQSFADFSARLPPGTAPGVQFGGSVQPTSFEGGEQRCFRDLFLCGGRIALNKDEAPAQGDVLLADGVPREWFDFGQAVAAYHSQQGRQQQGQAQQRRQAQQQRQARRGRGGGRGGAERRLRVVFLRRDSGGRQLLNARELVAACNKWRLQPRNGSSVVTFECSQASIPDVATGVAIAQAADIIVGMHGANMANAWFTPPGSSVLEIMPYEWVPMQPGALTSSQFNKWDPTSQLLWWVLITCDPQISEPGPEERAGTGIQKWWRRDRSVRLPWEALQAALTEVVGLGGDMQRYRQELFPAKRHHFKVGAAGLVTDARATCHGG